MKKRMIQMFLGIFFLSISMIPVRAEESNSLTNSIPDVPQNIHHVTIQVMPIALMYGILGADLGLRIAPRWSLAGSAQWGEQLRTGLERTITEFMVRAQYHLISDFGFSGWSVMLGTGNITTFRTISSSRNLYQSGVVYEWIGASTWVASLGLGIVYLEGTDNQRFQPDMIFRVGLLL